jgi:hypothetical protein
LAILFICLSPPKHISLLGRLPPREIDISIKDRREEDKRDGGTKNELRLP